MVHRKSSELNEVKNHLKNLERKLEEESSKQPKPPSFGARTCDDYKKLYNTSQSGYFWIDPDGFGEGDEPILVYCDLATGITNVQLLFNQSQNYN